MTELLLALESYGVAIVFIAVLLDQGGLPLPSFPLMVVAAAVATNAGSAVWIILVVATSATLLADLLWFAAGRRFGASMLHAMCRISLSPDSCVGSTHRIYGRWGAPSLILAKYIPGFAALATTLAGETGTGILRFAVFDGIGAALWAGGAIALGVVFHDAVEIVLLQLDRLGNYALIFAVLGLAAFLVVKWWRRVRVRMRIHLTGAR